MGPADCGYCVHGPKETTRSVRGYQDVIASVRVVNMRDQINLACRLQGPQTPACYMITPLGVVSCLLETYDVTISVT